MGLSGEHCVITQCLSAVVRGEPLLGRTGLFQDVPVPFYNSAMSK